MAAETIKLASGFTGKVSFLRNLECLYDSFGIGAHTIDASNYLFKMLCAMFYL